MGKTGFQIEGSDLFYNITEDRLRYASDPFHLHPIRYIDIDMAMSIERGYLAHRQVESAS